MPVLPTNLLPLMLMVRMCSFEALCSVLCGARSFVQGKGNVQFLAKPKKNQLTVCEVN